MKRPDLVEDEGRGHEDAHEEGHLHVEHQRLGRAREDELVREAGLAHRLRQEVEDLLVEAPADARSRRAGTRSARTRRWRSSSRCSRNVILSGWGGP